MRKILMCMIVFAGATAGLAQSTTSGSSLQDTTRLIQDKMNAVGELDYSISFHDTADNQNWVNQFKDEVTNAVADPASCQFRYHERLVVDGKERYSNDYGFDFKDVQDVVVLTVEQDLRQHGSHSTWERTANPEIWSLWVACSNKNTFSLYFRDEETANRVAEAMRQTVQMCGGK